MLPFPREFPLLSQEFEIFLIQIKWKFPQIPLYKRAGGICDQHCYSKHKYGYNEASKKLEVNQMVQYSLLTESNSVAQNTQTLTVDTLLDLNDGSSNNGLSLRDAIIIANSDPETEYIINLSGGQNYLLSIGGSGENSGDLDVLGKITIRTVGGGVATIDGTGLGDRLFHVLPGGFLNLENVVVTGGVAESGGGILVEENATANLTNITVSNNNASDDGGGIANAGLATLNNITVNGNSAGKSGGGIFNEGTVNLLNSNVSDNLTEEFGGGIDNIAEAILLNSTVSNNKAGFDGGGISNAGQATLTNMTVSGNSASGNGGGINNGGGGTSLLSNNTVTNNTADEENQDNFGNGGGIFNNTNENSKVTVRNTLVAGNFDKSNFNIFPDVWGEIEGNSFNLIGNITGASNSLGTGSDIVNSDPNLTPLQDNGGTTKTHAPLGGSPVINVGNNDLIPPDTLDLDGDGDITELVPFDGRGNGFPRVVEGIVDIGAVEWDGESKDLVAKFFDLIQEPLVAGESFDVQFEVENTEAGNAGEFSVDFYLSTNDWFSTNDKFLNSYQVNSLPGNNTTGKITINLDLPPFDDSFWGENGTYYVGMIVDEENQVTETNEENNLNQGKFIDFDDVNVTVNANAPDLAPKLLDVIQEPLFAGNNFDVEFEVENKSLLDAGEFAIDFYLSTNDYISTNDKLLGTSTISSLAGNTTTGKQNINLALPGGEDSFWQGTGEYYIGMIVDAKGQVEESDENNNLNQGEWIDYDGVNITVGEVLGVSDFAGILGVPDNTLF